MHRYEGFGECLKRALKEQNLSASEAARLVGFRSRNSIFRILAGDASYDVKHRFLQSLYEILGSQWPPERWIELREALSVDRLGPECYRANFAFRRMLHEKEPETAPYLVHKIQADGSMTQAPLKDVLCGIADSTRVEIVITGCCDSALTQLLAECCGAAGEQGRLVMRHYIDTAEETISQNILGILPLVSKTWYNARLVSPGTCPAEMMTVYRLNAIHVHRWDETGKQFASMYLRCDKRDFITHLEVPGDSQSIKVLDHWRFQLELLKPLTGIGEAPGAFVAYTQQYALLEEDCAILSIKPDIHYNCIPVAVLEKAIIEGFEQSGMAEGSELTALINALKQVHEQRFRNMMEKHKVTHLVYSLPMMERFMRTGVMSDHFFIQRAYTVEERRACIRVLLDAMLNQPYFNVHFLKAEMPPLRYEMTYYDGKGIVLMDAYSNYDLNAEHSEALLILPAFMDAFHRFFKDELLANYVLSRGETILALERLLVMNVQE